MACSSALVVLGDQDFRVGAVKTVDNDLELPVTVHYIVHVLVN